jgi:hypothetical protein
MPGNRNAPTLITPAAVCVGNTSYSLVGEVAGQPGVICVASFELHTLRQSFVALTVGWFDITDRRSW